jgi:hypothetical protein
MDQHQLFIWGNDTVGCRVLCGHCGTFFDSTFKELAEGETCPQCRAVFSEIDVDETGQCDHGVIGNGQYYTNKRLALTSKPVEKTSIADTRTLKERLEEVEITDTHAGVVITCVWEWLFGKRQVVKENSIYQDERVEVLNTDYALISKLMGELQTLDNSSSSNGGKQQ